MIDLQQLSSELASVVIFRNVTEGPVLTALSSLANCSAAIPERVACYRNFLTELFVYSFHFGDYLTNAVCEDENIYVRLRGSGEEIPEVLADAVTHELEFFAELTKLTPQDLMVLTGYEGYLPGFAHEERDLPALFEERMKEISQCGYGMYARHTMFQLRDAVITPVRSADTTKLSDLIGYDAERAQVIDNTKALIAGKPAANLLLVGDAGTGKSSTIKATVNALAAEGVRLIELRKEQLLMLPEVMEELYENPLKFIIFIDDLSFNREDDSFGTLKAILEGSVSARSSNVVIYATSNRRHLVKENFSDRSGDDVHINDTMQEMLSLSERFGKVVLFSKPDKKLYLNIVRELAQKKQIVMEVEELERQAEAFALRKGARSARAAEQFTDSLVSARIEE